MRIYLASSFGLQHEVQNAEVILECAGHKIVVKWWSCDGFDMRDKKRANDAPDAFYNDPVCRLIYERDCAGVAECDALVLIGGDTPKKFNGANVELGMALNAGKPCYAVGCLENSAMYYPVKRCRDFLELLNELERRQHG